MDAVQKPSRASTLTKGGFAIVALAVAGVVAFSLPVLSGLAGGPERLADGEGALGSYGVGGLGFDPKIGKPPWTVGIGLCVKPGNQPPVLDGSVGPTSIAGNYPPSALRFLGAYVREFNRRDHSPIGSVEGFPPAVPDKLYPVNGFQVKGACSRPSVSTDPYTELLIGVAPNPDNTSGGGWLGVDVGYTSGWRHHVLALEGEVMMCGPNAPGYACSPGP